MGYSGRYHAASLAAVFIALAIGILIGIGLADDVVSTASQELEDSLRDEADTAQEEAADLRTDIAREQQFSEGAYPALVTGLLARQGVAVIELGDVPDPEADDTADEVNAAIEAAGASLASVSSIALPADLGALVEAAGRRFAPARRDPAALRTLGAAIGSRLAGGGTLIERVKPVLFAGFNGDLGDVARIVVIRHPSEDLGGEDAAEANAFEVGLLDGIQAGSGGSVGVERSSTDPTTLSVITEAGIATVDHVDSPAGKVSLVYALAGTAGDFGTKEGASSFLPDLLKRPALASR